jgi:hypothetical protein
MSDMAGFALEHVMDAEYDRFEYRMGRMSDARAYELGVIDERGGYNHPPMFSPTTLNTSRTCKHCGKSGLRWANQGSGWRLQERDGALHQCEQYARCRVATASDF